MPELINKKVAEDRRGSYYYKNFNNREEDITKDRYGLALQENKTDQNEEPITMEKIVHAIERAMEKNKQYMDNFTRS